MSTEALAKSVQALRSQAAQLIAQYQQERRLIDNDRMLSLEGKEERLAAVYAPTAAGVKQLAVQEEKLLTDTLESLNRSLVTQLGSGGSDIIAMRDAEDRADRVAEPDEAARVLERAIRMDDRSLAHAIVRRASAEGWRNVVAQATTAYPAVGETLSDITTVSSQINSIESILHRAMNYSVSK